MQESMMMRDAEIQRLGSLYGPNVMEQNVKRDFDKNQANE
jgi:hypothetical protein